MLFIIIIFKAKCAAWFSSYYFSMQSNSNSHSRYSRSERMPLMCATGNNKVIAPVKGSAMNLARVASPFIGSLCRCIPGDINPARAPPRHQCLFRNNGGRKMIQKHSLSSFFRLPFLRAVLAMKEASTVQYNFNAKIVWDMTQLGVMFASNR